MLRIPAPPEAPTSDHLIDMRTRQPGRWQAFGPIQRRQLKIEVQPQRLPVTRRATVLDLPTDQLAIGQTNAAVQTLAVGAIEESQLTLFELPLGLLKGTDLDAGIEQGDAALIKQYLQGGVAPLATSTTITQPIELPMALFILNQLKCQAIDLQGIHDQPLLPEAGKDIDPRHHRVKGKEDRAVGISLGMHLQTAQRQYRL